jgi:hypothetical protein
MDNTVFVVSAFAGPVDADTTLAAVIEAKG